MLKGKEITIDGYSICFEEIERIDSESRNSHDISQKTTLSWSSAQLRDAIMPMVTIADSIKEAFENNKPDEIELSLLIKVGLKGEVPVLKIVTMESSSDISVKFKWKNDC